MIISKLGIIIWLLVHLGAAQDTSNSSSGRIAGIGVGTFLIILAIIFSIVWCLACRSSSRPELYSIGGLIIPGLLIIIFVFMPKEKDRVEESSETDMNFVTHIVFMVLALIAFLIAGASQAASYLFSDKKAKNIARSAFVIKEEEEDALTVRRSRVMGSRQGSEAQMRLASNQSNA